MFGALFTCRIRHFSVIVWNISICSQNIYSHFAAVVRELVSTRWKYQLNDTVTTVCDALECWEFLFVGSFFGFLRTWWNFPLRLINKILSYRDGISQPVRIAQSNTLISTWLWIHFVTISGVRCRWSPWEGEVGCRRSLRAAIESLVEKWMVDIGPEKSQRIMIFRCWHLAFVRESVKNDFKLAHFYIF